MKKRSRTPSPGPRTPPRVSEFLDRTADLDRELGMIANLCLSAEDRGLFDEMLVIEIGHAIRTHLSRRTVAEHFFLGRNIRRVRIELPLLRAEIAGLRAYGRAYGDVP